MGTLRMAFLKIQINKIMGRGYPRTKSAKDFTQIGAENKRMKKDRKMGGGKI